MKLAIAESGTHLVTSEGKPFFFLADGQGWPADHWTTGLDTEGVRNMQTAREILKRLTWHELRPAPQVLDGQPGWSEPLLA
ncbi:MAG: hypothetical protein ACLFNT_04130 [Spirochaetales bacterium]